MKAARALTGTLPVLAILLTVGAAELSLAWLRPVPFASESNLYFVADPHLGYRLKPDSVGFFEAAGVTGTVNRHGLRDDEFSAAKPAGELRILALGDSYTMGANVAQDATWPQVLERLLAQQTDTPVQVMNAGVGGYHPFHYTSDYQHHGRRLAPDLLLVGFFVGNDAFSSVSRVEHSRTAVDGRRVNRASVRAAPRAIRIELWLYAHSHLARRWFNRRLFVVAGDTLAPGGEPRDGGRFTPEYLQIQARKARLLHRGTEAGARRKAENAVAQIAQLAQLAAEDRRPLLVVMIPDENQINSSLARAVVGDAARLAHHDLSLPQRALAPMFAERGIEVLDLLPAFLADERRLYMNDGHWSEAGHRLAAERILAALRPRLAALAGSPS
jgi:lysophospholipase L1-like esterase